MKPWHCILSVMFIAWAAVFAACRGKGPEETFEQESKPAEETEEEALQPAVEEGATGGAEKKAGTYGSSEPEAQTETEPAKEGKDGQRSKKTILEVLGNPEDEGLMADPKTKGLMADLLPGEKTGYGYKKTSPAKIIPGKPEVKGSLPREIVKKVVKEHHDEMRLCYEKQHFKDRDLKGTVTLQFAIAPTGKVQVSKISDSTMDNPAVESCLIGAVKKWTFPEPKGGDVVIVTYPFTFEPVKKKETDGEKKKEEGKE